MTVRRIKRNNLGLDDKAQVDHIAYLGPERQDYTDDAALLATAVRGSRAGGCTHRVSGMQFDS
jgi:hypothetical protein